MDLAYAASQGGEHGAETNIGEVILHHVLDAKIISINILGIDLSITRLLCFGRAEVYFISLGPVVAWRTRSQRYLLLAARVGDARAHRGSRLA
jgi:hypothetical protein